MAYVVVTSINPFNSILERYAAMTDWTLLVVGDRKGPPAIDDPRVLFFDVDEQSRLGFDFAEYCPENHYSRKNIGYLAAMSRGSDVIAETDDDNIPKDTWGVGIEFHPDAVEVKYGDDRYFNIYSEFCDELVWPRGFPLQRVLQQTKIESTVSQREIGVWQYLADGNPDVDAIYRLTRGRNIEFSERDVFALNRHLYTPMNSQNTFWNPKAFPVMYLPTTVSSRVCDIMRGYVAQRVLWEGNMLVGIGGATVFQERNPHDLMRDFEDEVPLYTQTEAMIDVLESLELSGSLLDCMTQVYEGLAAAGHVSDKELPGIGAWARDLRRLGFD